MVRLRLDPSERWILLGKTGAGKTQFAKYLLRQVAAHMRVVVIDPNELWLGKGKGGRPEEWASRKELGTVDKPHLIEKFNPKWRVQCLQPDIEGAADDERLIKLCYDVIKAGNTFIYFDESTGIATANHVPRHIMRIWKTGRAHGVGAWVGTQAPTGIPKIFKSQAEHFVTFKVGDEDVDVVASMVHMGKEEVARLKKYEWMYYNTEMERGIWNAPVPIPGGRL